MLRKPVGFAAARAKGAEGVVESAGGVGASALPMNAERSGSPMTPLPSRQPGRRHSRKDRSRTIFGRGGFPASSSWEPPITTSSSRRRAQPRRSGTAEFLVLGDANHYAAHASSDELLLDAVLSTLRANSGRRQ